MSNNKWADYVILRVRYNDTHTHIVQVEAAPDLGESFGQSGILNRSEVLAKLDQGYTFVTAPFDEGVKKYRKGAPVEPVWVNNTRYIRTDRNSTAKDNLGNLPEF